MGTTAAKEWAGFAAHMLPPPPSATPEQLQARNEQMLMRALSMRTTVAVVGSGCSVPLEYPTWRKFAQMVVSLTSDVLPADKREIVLGFERQLAREDADETSTDLMMYYIGACQDLLALERATDKYHAMLTDVFKIKSQDVYDKIVSNPYKALLGLPISRFVTTNFDCEIERTLERMVHLVKPGTFFTDAGQINPRSGSFHQLSDKLDAFARFGLANMRENRYNVFHCHGRYDCPQSIVASERNYQDTYLADNQRSSVAFRQSLELLLGSNPLLFVGYGLKDDDLLRPLRHLGALDQQHKYARPIFALLPLLDDRDRYRHAMLFERYGLKVLPFEVSGNDLAGSLCRTLAEIGDKLQDAWQEWLKKPRLRTPRSTIAKSLPFLEMVPTKVPLSDLPGFHERVAQPGIICVEGSSGSGKSIHCLKVMQKLAETQGPFDGAFYWNFHYGNDLLAVVDTMLCYFNLTATGRESRIDQFRKCLRQRNLVIFDACERLMPKADVRTRAKTYSALFQSLLDACLETGINSTVVLAGRVLPNEIETKGDGRAAIQVFRTTQLRSKDLMRCGAFAHFEDESDGHDLVAALCEVLQGHNYALLMASHYLEFWPVPKRWAILNRLIQDLAQRPADHRLHEMVSQLLRKLDDMTGDLATPFLQLLALFLSPVSDEALRICYWQADQSRKLANKRAILDAGSRLTLSEEDLERLNQLRELLLKTDFLFSILGVDQQPTYYCVHATARSQLFQTIHGQAADALPDFGLSGPLSGRVGVDPGSEQDSDISGLFRVMLEQGELAADSIAACSEGPATHYASIEARHLCRDAFGLIRGRMEANTASRWCRDFETYAQFAIRTAVLAKRVAPTPAWSYGEAERRRSMAEHSDSPLYLGELAWLYNDVAMSLYYLGRVRDAYSVWEQTWEIGRLAGALEDAASLQTEVRLSLISCFIEMGQLPAARRILDDFTRTELPKCGDEVVARVHGLQAMIHHLQGNLPRADRQYRKCLMALRGRNLRAESYFQKQHADLKISMDDRVAAEHLIRASRAHAEAGVFPDLVLFARVTEAHLLVKADKFTDALREYRTLLREAQRLRLRRQEAEIEFSMARCALHQGDAESARQLAMNSLRIANENGLGLRLTHSLVVLGLAMLATGGPGHRKIGIAYLHQALQLAKEQEYWHRGREIEQKLLEMGEELSPVRSTQPPRTEDITDQ